jgi:hypothetical protein
VIVLRSAWTGTFGVAVAAVIAASHLSSAQGPAAQERTLRVAVEATRDGTAMGYEVRYHLATAEDGPAIIGFDVDAPGEASGLRVESPAGWRGVLIPADPRTGARSRIAWSCAHEGWEHQLKHRIRPGQSLGGFRIVDLPPAAVDPDSGYRLYVDSSGVGTPSGLVGTVLLRRRPARSLLPERVERETLNWPRGQSLTAHRIGPDTP